MELKILNKINEPKDLKNLTVEDMKKLAGEIREVLLEKVSQDGGHLGPNLGMVEATIAMHYTFNSPIDKFVFDVSHQTYTHKILTGRKEAFINPEKYDTVTGFTNPKESEHDFFTIGHTSTGVSLASGLAKGRDILGGEENILAVVGDGSLSGGEAYEGLDNAAISKSNIIILVNDNDIAITENAGGLYENLALLRETEGKAENNIFKALGFDYYFVKDGNDIKSMIDIFEKVKDVNHPVLIHMYTLKGKGYEPAVENEEKFHWTRPFDLETGEVLGKLPESYLDIIDNFLIEKAKNDKKIVAITAATPSTVGLNKFRKVLKNQYINVGIAEEHAVAFASGIAKRKAKPVASFFSSFIQRCYDQLSQDLAINDNPATILVCGGGISGNAETHLSVFDIPLISNIPNIVYLAPTSQEELEAMMDWAIDQEKYPVIIRIPTGKVVSTGVKIKSNFYDLNKFVLDKKGEKIAIIGLGTFYSLGETVREKLIEKGFNPTLINPRFISGIDDELLEGLMKNHELVITLEDGILDGGFGGKIARYYSDKPMKVLNFGAQKVFTDNVPLEELYKRYELMPEQIVEKIEKEL